MNFKNFSKWLKEKLIPNLEPGSVIVLDNAKYHNVQENKKPTISSLKKDMIDWLTKNGIPFNEPIKKAELMLLINQVIREPEYSIDTILRSAGHTVLRLPPYHPDLNLIELVWGDIKGRVAECLTDSLQTKRQFVENLFSEYSVEKWKKCCQHVKDIEEIYWLNDALMDETVDRLVISVNTGESSDSETDNNSTDENGSCTESGRSDEDM
jgi:transposase